MPRNTPNPVSLPPLIFGEQKSSVRSGFHGLVDQFSHLTPDCDYDSKAKQGFFYKGNVFSLDSLVINQNYYSHMLAVSSVQENNLLIPLTGTHHGLWQGEKLAAQHEQGFFIPRNDRFQFQTGIEEIAGSLIITYDLDRLNRTLQIMTGQEKISIQEDQVRHLPLTLGTINFKKLFLSLFAQIDQWDGNIELLQLNGFDDQFYRLLAITLQPNHFFNPEIIGKGIQKAYPKEVMTAFERHVADNLDKPLHLSSLEATLGVSTRALQYACQKRHGCSPREYIRKKRLQEAYARLIQSKHPIKLANLAFELGFSSQSQFSRYFREQFGTLPSVVAASYIRRPS